MQQEDLAQKIIRRQEQLYSNRSVWESHWREIDRLIAPRPDQFGGATLTPGQKSTEYIFDSTATLALNRFAAAMESMLTPRTQRWHTLRTGIQYLDKNVAIKRYLEAVTDLLFSTRYAPRANFASQMNECYRSLGKFGTGAVFVDDDLGKGIRYKSVDLSELFIAEDASGMIDTVYRKFKYTAYQAVDAFGKESLPEQILSAYDTNPDENFEFIHAVYPNDLYDERKRDAKAMKFKSCYVSIEGKKIVSESGYRTMPYAVSRYITNPNEIYGRSPAMDVLPDVKMVNEIAKTQIRAAQRQVDPVLLAPEDGSINSFSMKPGAINYGGVNENGQQLVVPLQTAARVDISDVMIQQRHELINDTFLVTLFQILVETPSMTATEAMYRQQEKGALLAPTMGRQQSELLGPIIERELDILAMAGVLPPMPDEMLAISGEIEVEYVSPLNRAQKADEAIGIMNTIQAVAGVAQFDPTVLSVFNFDAAARALADINGMPADTLYSEEEVDAKKQAQAQQQQLQQILQAAPVAADAAKTLVETQQLASQPVPSIAG